MKEQRIKKKQLLFNILTLLSFILLCLTILLFYLSYKINAWEQSFSLSNDFHISLYRKGNDCRLAFFNVKNYPYTGSIVGLGGEWPKTIGFGNFLGLYYRHFTWPKETLWTLYISLWYPLILFGILPVFFLYRVKRESSDEQWNCFSGGI